MRKPWPAPRQAVPLRMSSQERGRRRDVEVLLVEHEVADQTGVGVHADAQHQAAGLCFLSLDFQGNCGIGPAH